MQTLLDRVNHVLDVDLSKPLGRRTKGFLLAVLLVMIAGQIPLFAQAQSDCVGSYEHALDGYYNQLMTELSNIENNYSWYNPMRTILTNAAGVEYYARAEGAMFQMVGCMALPMK
jgi:hypothetical protein